ncbi:hypothetical protein Ga0102493_112597 [Erythrobacter litoralis]|jgi:DNA-binding MarR family transcriptional regulator|uniref:HTH marR-type domain-containing protein n=1 Tax=Erythrobacter litoralis TaxID=39960 RepID=A0A074N3Y2_9SPHN|nr:hypothetical protein [Erythrobacter litoralis]AOL23609.1 hypothetical protein Ga0102493_112597 [Erythrobacter litoralis]KEO98908.1 hypothetical protein EH32_07325 [Erythrobacter litoralis]MEE4339665.1 hypothetical protein [Erythrobacter sp.]
MLSPLRPIRSLFARIGAREPCSPADPPLREGGIVLAALMTEAIRQREAGGHQTTLRQLHCVLGISQPSALRIAHLLAREGVVRIEENMSDRFESTVRLSPETQRRFMALAKENIAVDTA